MKNLKTLSKCGFGINALLALIMSLFFIIFPSCQKSLLDEEMYPAAETMTALEPLSDAILYYGVETFMMDSKEPSGETQQLTNQNYKYYEKFSLKVQYGKGSNNKNLMFEILVDNEIVTTSDDFSNRSNIIVKELTGLLPASTLEIRMEGNKGKCIYVWIECSLQSDVISDIDGNYYHTVKIGDQWWMAENLKTTRFRNGDIIPTTDPANLDLSRVDWDYHIPLQWAYNGDESKVADYGRMYFWYGTTDNRGLCPTGWHVPTIEEWTSLSDYLGGSEVAGGKLKEAGTDHWLSPNIGATNETGFTALPGGSKWHYGDFAGMGYSGHWWTSSVCPIQSLSLYSIFCSIDYNSGVLNLEQIIWQKTAKSVRCIKD